MDAGDDRVQAAVEEIAVRVRALASQPWRRAEVVSRYASRRKYATTVVFEFTDGATVEVPAPTELTNMISHLAIYLPSLVWMFRCTLMPSSIESVEIDAESDPYPDGWDDALELRELEEALPESRRPEWLRRRLGDLGKRPTRAALWTAAVLGLLEDLGPDWDHRGSGNNLRLVRLGGLWLVHVVLMERTRSALAATVRVVVDDLVDGSDVLHLNQATRLYLDTLERPDCGPRITSHVLGEGCDFLDGWTPKRWGRAAIERLDSVHFAASNGNHQARDLVAAAAWQLVLDPGTTDPIARRALDATRQHAAEQPIDKYDAEAKQRRLRNAEQLMEIARLDPVGRREAMLARAAAKLAAIGLDESQRKRVRKPGSAR